MKFSVDVVANTGGHDGVHSVMRPKGKLLDCRSGNEVESTVCTTQLDGKATVTFNSSQVSGTHIITAECVDPICAGSASGNINVKVPGLAPVPGSSLYVFVGGEAGKAHTDNHYLTPTASNILGQLAREYHQQFPFSPVLRVNDASLTWGGVLDIKGTWSEPHKEHRRGSVVDVRANNDARTAMPEANFPSFKEALI